MPAYSGKAQPYLDAIAASVFTSQEVRNWLIKGTPAQTNYAGSSVLTEEQRALRWRAKPTKQPFWANYWCGPDSRCSCRIDGSKGLESDAIFFFRNSSRRVLAVHVEFKHVNEAFSFGQPEAYPLRAACFAKTYHERPTLNAHDDWTTIIFCGAELLSDKRLSCFQRIITHREAAQVIEALAPLLPLASQGQRYAASVSSVYVSGSQKPPTQRTAKARAALRTAIDSGSASHDGSTTILIGKAPKDRPSGLTNLIAVKADSPTPSLT